MKSYQPLTEVSQNPRASLYQGRDPHSGLQVAVKQFRHLQFNTASAAERLAVITASLHTPPHPAILPLLDAGVQDQKPYFVFPWMEGGSLADRLKDGPLDLLKAVETFTPLAAALDAAASQDLFHHDLKPENIFFDEQGKACLAELGFIQALAADSAARLEPANPPYASPEQVRELPLDARSHVYSVGAVLYHALTGRPPFQGATDNVTLFKHIIETPRRPRELGLDLPESAETALLKALSKYSEERYPTARAFIQALTPALETVVETPTTELGIEQVVSLETEEALVEQFPLSSPGAREPRKEVTSPPVREKRSRVWVSIGIIIFVILGMRNLGSYLNKQAEERAHETATARAGLVLTTTAQEMKALHESRSQWPIVLIDNFTSNENFWGIGDRDNQFWTGTREISNGKYHWRATAKQGFYWWIDPLIPDVSDFYLTVEAQQVQGPVNGEYGLAFRLLDENNLYRLQISDNQQFVVGLLYQGEWVSLISMTSVTAIRPAEINRLTVIAEGSHFTFFINDEFVGQVEDNRISRGRAAVTIGLLEAGDKAVYEFDNFELRAIKTRVSAGYYSKEADVHYASGEYEQAITAYTKVIQLDPGNASAHNNLAWILVFHLDREYDFARAHALRAVELKPSAANHDTLALVYYKLQRYESALEHYNIALSLDPNQPTSLKGRADVHLALENKQAALEDYKAYLQIWPEAPDQEFVAELIRKLGVEP